LSIQLAQTWTKKTLHLRRRQVSWMVESAARPIAK
jgi:hypothetical protein